MKFAWFGTPGDPGDPGGSARSRVRKTQGAVFFFFKGTLRNDKLRGKSRDIVALWGDMMGEESSNEENHP